MSDEEKKTISSGGTGIAAFPAVHSLRQYGGVSYRVFEDDEDSLVWGDEGVYYMQE